MDALSIGPLVVSTSRLAALLGMAATLALAAWFARREPALKHWAGGALIAGLLAGRAGYVLARLDVYAEAPWTALYLWHGEFSLAWGLAGAAAYTLVRLGRRHAAIGLAAVSLGAGVSVWAGSQYALQGPAPTQTALPSSVLMDMQGAAASLGDFEGQAMVVNLWATWCPPCRREMPVLSRGAADNPDVAFVFVNQGEAPHTIERFLDQEELALEHMLLDTDGRLAFELQARGLPTTLFYRAEGELAAVHLGEVSAARLNDYLRKLR